MITVGEKLWAPMTDSPCSRWSEVTTPSMGATTTVLRTSSLVLASMASCCRMRRFWASTAAVFILRSASAWSNSWSEMSLSARIFFARSKARWAFWTSASARVRSARAACTASSDCCLPASRRVASMRASICPRRTVSPSLTLSSVMRPETSAATFTNFLGLISPDADTVETRSRRATFWVWTGILFRRSLVTLKATTPPMARTATTPMMIRVLFDTAIPPPPGRPFRPARTAVFPGDRPKYKIRTPHGKVSVSLEPCCFGAVRPRAAGVRLGRNDDVRIRTPYTTNGFRRPVACPQSPDRGRQPAGAAAHREDAGRGRLRGVDRARRAGGHREGDGRRRGPRHPRRDDAAHERVPGLPSPQDRAHDQGRARGDPHQQGPGGRSVLGPGDGRGLLHHQGLR